MDGFTWGQLRRKLEADSSQPHYLPTEAGLGFVWNIGNERVVWVGERNLIPNT